MKSLISRFDGAIRKLFGGLLKLADDLRAIRRVDAVELVLGFCSFAADDQRILAAEFALNFLERRAHRRSIFLFAEVC